ncbi:MAG: uL15m family ribosomal protein [Candidatus Hydrothermarchaeota archaeon]
MIRKERKTKKYRGSKTCGGGSKKNRRGAGNRGGRGRAGMHKHKWTYTVKYASDHFGKYGFKRAPSLVKPSKAINVGELEDLLNYLIAEGKIKKKKKIVLDLKELGYTKVLGKGKLEKALTVKAPEFSRRAVEKIESAGGQAVSVG